MQKRRYLRLAGIILAGLGGLLAIGGLVSPSRAGRGTPYIPADGGVTPLPTPQQVFLPLALHNHDAPSEPTPTPEPVAAQQLPPACYAADAETARETCLLELRTAYLVTLTFNSDLFLAFPITETLAVSVTAYSHAGADVDLVLWGENEGGQNVEGPFHPGPVGGPHSATWTPRAPYVTPGIHLVELFSATGYPFTVHLTVEDPQ
jgi:hypothetical protein